MAFQPLFNYASDIHMALSAWVDRPSLQGDANESLRQIIDSCIQRGLPLVLGGDDVDQKRPGPSVIALWCRQLDRMQQANLPIYYIQGQHGQDRFSPWLNVHAWPIYIHRQLVNIRGVNVYGIDWCPRGEFQEELAQVPPQTNILVTHTVWEEFMGARAVTDGSQKEVPHASMLLTGDFHKTRQEFVVTNDGRQMLVVSNGSTCLQDISEPLPKCYHVIGTDSGSLVALPQQLITRERREYNIMTVSDLQLFVNDVPYLQPNPQMPPEIALPAVKIRYSESIEGIYNRLIELAAPQDRLFLEPIPVQTEEIVVDYDAAPLGAFDGLNNAIVALAAGDQQLATDARRLLAAADRAAELEAMYQEHLAAYHVSNSLETAH